MSKGPETKFKERVQKDLAKLISCYSLKTQERARRGVPDLLICLKGRYVAIELKVDGETPTLLQTYVIQRIRAAGGIAFSSTPSQWDEHYAMLKEIK